MRQSKFSVFIAATVILISCGSSNGSSDSPEAIAKKWCDLNAKVHQAPDGGDDYRKAKEAREKYEQQLKEKYSKDEALMKKIGDEIEKCEDASEGR